MHLRLPVRLFALLAEYRNISGTLLTLPSETFTRIFPLSTLSIFFFAAGSLCVTDGRTDGWAKPVMLHWRIWRIQYNAAAIWSIELSLTQLFKTEQVLAESACLSVCVCVHEHRNALGRLEKLHSDSSRSRSRLGRFSAAAAAAAVWWREIPASHGMLSLCFTSTGVS